MTKEEIKKYLLEHRANSSLVSMPAVMERIYACFEIDSNFNLITGNFYEMNSNLSETISIDIDGNITLNDNQNTRIFKSKNNGEATYINRDETGYSIDEPGEYSIDESGMDKGYSNGSDHIANRKENATVDVDGLIITDNGTPILNLYDLINSKGNKTWENNKNYLVSEYPNTRKWFEKKEKQFKTRVDTEKEIKSNQHNRADLEINKLRVKYDKLKKENEDLRKNTVPKKEYIELKTEKRRAEIEKNIFKTQIDEHKATTEQLEKQRKEQQIIITNLQAENEQNKQQVQRLKISNQNLQRMLKTTLDFCESVRNSFLGRVFFGSKLKQLPSGTQVQEHGTNNKKEEQVR